MLKLSGGAIAGDDGFGFNREALTHICDEVLSIADLGIQVCIVVGGGNIFRGNVAKDWNIDRVEADNMGMMATFINAVLLRAALKSKGGHEVRVMSALATESIAEPFIRLRALRHLKRGYIVVFAGGIGQPYVTTDYPAVQRALQCECDAILVAKQGVDGVYSADPNTDSDARRYETLSYDDFVQKNLRVMDQSALLLARDHDIPVHIFNFDTTGTIRRICLGENLGTSLSRDTRTVLAMAPSRDAEADTEA
jgi:uridylate kinase